MNRFVAIDIGQLRIGMYVHLEMGWLSHPFPVNSFKITTQEQLQTLQALKLSHIQYDPRRSDVSLPPVDGEAEAEQVADAPRLSAHAQEMEHWSANIEVLRSGFHAAQASFDAVQALAQTQPQLARSRSDAAIDNYVTHLAAERDLSLHLLFDESGGSASAHGVNTAMLALLLGKTLGFDAGALHDLGVAALLHDLGKQRLNIFPSSCALNELVPGRAQPPQPYASHVGESVALAQAMGYAPAVTTAIAQHHEWADGSGFPLGLLASDMDRSGQILALVNHYERLCNPPARGMVALTPHEALASLYGPYRQRFSPELLSAFVQTLGVYPPGSWVELTDGRQGLIVSVNMEKVLKPTVMAYGAAAGQSGQQLVELHQQSELGVRRGLNKDQVLPKVLATLQPYKHLCYFFDSSAVAGAEKVSS